MFQQNTEFLKKQVLIVYGQNIKKAREMQSISITQLSIQTKYDRVCLSQLERGEQNIQLKTALKLAAALNVSFSSLFSRSFMDKRIDGIASATDSYIEDEYLRIFIENFKRALQFKQHKQFTVYVETGISDSIVSRIIQGKVDNPTLQTLAGLAYTINTDMCSLFSRTENKEELF